MKILPIQPFSINTIKRNPQTSLTFRKNDEGDYFSFSKDYRYTKVKDIKGKDVYVTTKKQDSRIPYGHNAFEYVIKRDKQNLGFAIALDKDNYDGLYLSDLHTQENKLRQYKGLGTELLKCIVKESYDKGFGGKLLCCAYHENSPFVFYYKNNFRICDNKDSYIENPAMYNVPLHYVTINNLEVFDILPKNCELLFFELDKKGADAFMKNKRLYEDVICEDVAKTEIGGDIFSAQYIKFPDDNKSYLQILNESAKCAKLTLILALEETSDSDGQKEFKIVRKERNLFHYSNKVNNFAKSLLDDLAQKYL